jgi:ubiquinone/menaquinone biosynthesis C-methylase UbiE
VVIGNHTPKYSARNPAIRWLTRRWVANLDRVLGQVGAEAGPGARALEVGCGEGVIADRLHQRFGEVVALDLPDAGLRADWRGVDGPRFLHANALELPFGDDRFDVVVAAEVLEHLPDPDKGLEEMARVGRRHLVVSVPENRSSVAATWSPAAMCARWATPPGISTTGPGAASSASSPRSPRSGQ